MLQSVPSRNGGGKPRLLVSGLTCLTPILVQVIQAGITLYLAESDTQLMGTDDSGVIDALQINQQSGIVILWIMGDLWAAGSQLPGVVFKPIIYIPGLNNTSGSMLTGAAKLT